MASTPDPAVPAAGAAPRHAACENCRAALGGPYCHQCGQPAHNPLKHVGHAIEEVFESFWHLDGRIFRTLRDLLVPGRVAANYLGGQRVGYVQPLRLFVILTVFTFFVGKLTVHVDDFDADAGARTLFASAQTAAEVEALRAARVAEIERRDGGSPTAAAALALAIAAVDTAAAQRTAELAQPAPAATPRESAVTRATRAAARAVERQHAVLPGSPDAGADPAPAAPAAVPDPPSLVDAWLDRRMQAGKANVARMGRKSDLYVQAFLTALPGALFLLMPVFALVLRVTYLGRGTGYLEHLVVALYSHAWLMLVLLATFLTIGIANAVGNSAVNAASDGVLALLWLSVPLYLLLMQRRVYGGRWWTTWLRYTFAGSVYSCLVMVVVAYAALAGVLS
ncbi:DUF3667 domain-containing protein [Stenotrophomonas mori]|uniref:DUF3667 domain-containing protein n=1 Tax=Stenotrophomonas mori TaxID=2871096 RepID=A0ABT0SKL2_9GAMM|nr:DUF3667 domain-containing protein [Stenotrophomonas mori]MCL7715878.1 DUF3667 domain-containing protein [Stenotrophomonas mori]